MGNEKEWVGGACGWGEGGGLKRGRLEREKEERRRTNRMGGERKGEVWIKEEYVTNVVSKKAR